MPTEPKIEFPLVVPGTGWRRRANLALGYAAATLMPARVKAIEAGTIGEHLSAADRLIVGALVHRAIAREEPLDHLAYLHRHLWNGDHITTFHASAENRFDDWFLPYQSIVIDALEKDLAAQTPGQFHTLCEIGTGSGIVLDYLSRRLAKPGISTCIGLDLSPAQVAIDAQRFPACRFIAADACEWIPEHAGPGWIFFCCGGVLEYIPQAALAKLFAHTVANHAPARWVIVEPVDLAHDLINDTKSRPFGFESTWSHHYPHLLTQAGMTVIYQHEIHIIGLRWQLVIAGV